MGHGEAAFDSGAEGAFGEAGPVGPVGEAHGSAGVGVLLSAIPAGAGNGLTAGGFGGGGEVAASAAAFVDVWEVDCFVGAEAAEGVLGDAEGGGGFAAGGAEGDKAGDDSAEGFAEFGFDVDAGGLNRGELFHALDYSKDWSRKVRG